MNTSPEKLGTFTFFGDIDHQPARGPEKWLIDLQAFLHPHREHLRTSVETYGAVSYQIASKISQVAHAAVLQQSRRLLPILPWVEISDTPQEPDPVEMLLGEFDSLDREQKDKVAKNVVLLWDSFQTMFGGISGFLATMPTEQDAFMEKLEAAATRMEPAKGTNVAFHYFTVELTRQYISFFRLGRSDRQAVALASCVVSLIDNGRRMAPEPVASLVHSSAAHRAQDRLRRRAG